MADRIAREVVKCDPAILGLLVLDQAEGSRVLAVARSPNLAREEYADPGLVERFAIAATVVWGAAETASQLMGRREFIIGAFKEQLVLLVDMREYQMLLAMRLNRSSNAEHVYSKISNAIGIA